MPTPSHRPGSFTAKRVFTDRDEARDLFAGKLDLLQRRDEYRILNYSGVGGLGKSALCAEFEKHIRSYPELEVPRLAWAKVNFEEANNRQPTNALLALRFQLAKTGKLRFPAFDTAFARYFALTQAGRDLNNTYPELSSQPNNMLQELVALNGDLRDIPGLGLLLKYTFIAKDKIYLEGWLKQRGNELLQGLDDLAPHQLEAELPKYLGADITDWLEADADRRVAMLYDTCEALWRDRPIKDDTQADEWLRRLIAETPGVLHVILGRDPLAWADRDPAEWRDIIIPFPLGILSDDDAENFLKSVPIEEADIRANIVQGARGIPFYLDLQVDQYENCKRGGQTPQADQYGGTQPEILQRFTSHLPGDLRRALVVAACPRWLDEALFLNLCGQFLGGMAAVRLADLTRYSFWTETGGHHYLHAVMRDHLQDDSRKNEAALYQQIHRHLFEHYDKKLQQLESAKDLTGEHAEALSEGAYHLQQIDRAVLPLWVDKYTKIFYLAAQWTVLLPLLQQSLAIRREIGDKHGEGATLNNMATIAQARGDYDTVLDYLNQSLAICREIGNKQGEGATLNNMAAIAHACGDYDTALNYLNQSLAIRREIGDTAGLCRTLFNMGHIHLQNRKLEEAVKRWLESYTLAKQLDLAQALDALEELAGKIGLPGGLEGWEKLARQRDEQNPP